MMSAEVECGSSLTANCSSRGENQNSEPQPHKSDTTLQHEETHTSPGLDLNAKPNTEALNVPLDVHETCTANDKENENANHNNVDSIDTAKKNVVEAPPPKVNPWTKNNTGRVSNNTVASSPQDKGTCK